MKKDTEFIKNKNLDKIKIIEFDLDINKKGGYICESNKNYIIFINANITDSSAKEQFLKLILDHISTFNNSIDKYDVFLPNGNI